MVHNRESRNGYKDNWALTKVWKHFSGQRTAFSKNGAGINRYLYAQTKTKVKKKKARKNPLCLISCTICKELTQNGFSAKCKC